MSKRQYLCFPNFKKKAITFSYDDGIIFDLQLVDIFKKNGLKATFNINSGKFGTYRRLSKQNAYNLFNDKMIEVAVHGSQHIDLTAVSLEKARAEIEVDRRELEDMFGNAITGMAYAYGRYNQDIVNMIKELGITYSRTVAQTQTFDLPTEWLEWGGTCRHMHPCLMDFAKEFIENDMDKASLFYVWGHSYEFNDNDDWHVIENLAEYVGGKKDIWYATNGEIYDYVTAFDNLEWSLDEKYVKNNSVIDLYIDYKGKKIKVGSRQTVGL